MYKKFLLAIIFTVLFTGVSRAAINAQIQFEDAVPAFVRVNGNGRLELSAEKFKDGRHSAKFSWLGQAELVFSNFSDIEASMKTVNGGVIFWIYNTVPSDAPMRFTFFDWDGKEICHFDFGMQFRGWRTAWIKYVDMLTPDGGHYGDRKASERPTNVARMTMRPSATVPTGTVYVDRVSFMKTRMHDQITPDQQIPDNNYNLKRNMWHWCRLWEWEQYPELKPAEMDDAMRAELETVIARVDEWAAEGNPGPEYTQGTLLKRADDLYSKYCLGRLPDGSVTGAPLLSDDEFNNSLGEMRIRFIQDLIYWYALDYLYTGNRSNVDRVIVAMDHAIDQGFAFGSGWGTNHHYGYQIRNLYRGLWILRKEIEAAGRLEEYSRTLAYWSGIAECRLPFQYGRDEMLDSWHTLLNCKVISALMMPDEAMSYSYMKALGTWVSGSMDYSPGTLGGFKVDGTSFHHGGLYPAYSVGAFAALGDFCFFTRDTEFVPDENARRCFKHVLLTMRNYCNLTDWGLGICGRHPFNGFIPKADIEAYGRLAVLGDLSGSGMTCDPELGGAYITLGGSDKDLLSELKKAGVSAQAAPEGFFVYNYGAMGIHRRENWMITLKAYNSDVWASEIYAADNRFGRYQSYGSVQLIGDGSPVSAKESGFSQEGWDWNRVPGATTIHLPFDMLDSPLKGTLMERNDNPFPGVSSLEGRNGVLAFTYVEKDRVNFCPGATATKSVFCFDNRIVFIGTGITNSSSYPTETTLYQLRLDDRAAEIDVDMDYFGSFPLSYRHGKSGQTVITDIKDNYYILRDGKDLVLLKQHQKSPSDTRKKEGEGDFVTAYLDHGVSPGNASYEYMMLVKPSIKDVNRFTKKLPYTVIRADNMAHVVSDHITGITAYVCYGPYDGADYAERFAPLSEMKDSRPFVPVLSADAQTIVMERSLGEGRSVMSICTPDLGITKKGYTTAQESQPLVRTVVLDGIWETDGENADVSISSDGSRTTVSATCRHGQPVEFILIKTK